ncbi:putative Ketosynthase family 3 (KS3) domain-containing protein [Seiridium unicorne]|uniref:Ketosynthase family 3 (KS3) domain-containing protein n=1 Tax=Seiridium unicorne TaxID=138068 RepID=A0ABR2VBI1_9PEZI
MSTKPTGLCHTFDVAADGYVKAEAVSAVVVKRLEDAIKHRDPIRAIILGTASTSNGRTPGIASPSAVSQALAIQAAYSNAQIRDYNQTTYLECHGTGTQAGDPAEVGAAGSIFAVTRPAAKPLLIGSIKSNIGRSEPAAGNSSLIKVILSMENGLIPGTPTFFDPNPRSVAVDFPANRVKAFRSGIPWPEDSPRRASINSFGVGGPNSHVIIEHPPAAMRRYLISSYLSADKGFAVADDESPRQFVIVLSANCTLSLQEGIRSLSRQLFNPRVKVDLPDLAYTLSERRTKFWHRAFITTRTTEIGDMVNEWAISKESSKNNSISFIFTGQGAQWPQMGRDLLRFFPWTRNILQELDDVLQNLSNPRSWSLITELTEARDSEHLRQPEFSQPLVTALQLCIVAVLEQWGIRPQSVVGHSSGEIAAAYMAGLLDRANAIRAAFYRGQAALLHQNRADSAAGMLAVGLDARSTLSFINKNCPGKAWIACFNSPSSVTVSGKLDALVALRQELTAAGHFARQLHVDMAYHTELMEEVGDKYEDLLNADALFHVKGWDATVNRVAMFSSVTADRHMAAVDAAYWKRNMVSAVHFEGALRAMLASEDVFTPNILVEIGPSGALAGPVTQVLKSIAAVSAQDVAYYPAWTRGKGAGKALFDVAGHLWTTRYQVDLALVNAYGGTERCIVDLPNYSWDHSTKVWHENAASKEWRFRKYVVHDILGSKILGTTWHAPMWRSHLSLANLPFLLDHKIGGNAIMPGAGFITMALEAIYQKHCVFLAVEGNNTEPARNGLCYRFRNVRFNKALVLEEKKNVTMLFTLTAVSNSKSWHEFHISTATDGFTIDHSSGSVCIQDPVELAAGDHPRPLKLSQPAQLWYKWLRENDVEFGPASQKLIEVEAIEGEPSSGALISLEPPEGKYHPQSHYPVHPAALDGCIQAAFPAMAFGNRTAAAAPFIPSLIDDLVINKVSPDLLRGLSRYTSIYSGRGRLNQSKSWFANTIVHDTDSGQLAVQITGMHYASLDVASKHDSHTFYSVFSKSNILFTHH